MGEPVHTRLGGAAECIVHGENVSRLLLPD
jgi:hypothetical protein